MSTDRKTKIVATIGPASLDPDVLDAMVESGMSVARINMSHGSVADHALKIQAVREAAIRCNTDVAILADLPGPKIRAGKFPDGGVPLIPGQTVKVFPSMEDSTADEIHIDYPTLLTDVHVGNRIVLGDGAISLETVAVGSHHLLKFVRWRRARLTWDSSSCRRRDSSYPYCYGLHACRSIRRFRRLHCSIFCLPPHRPAENQERSRWSCLCGRKN